ncbi:MAG: putative 4-hydroxybenzoate polyprenyltransferase [Fibromonadaceae bacterium]|jgi:4-hydroxybenzoate polyprenyltransferase|nr:putative 4-hydroxybenzoate polyprenyltransferase [Fibromonadaceae bacterium]
MFFLKITEYSKLVRLSHTFFALPFALASMLAAAKGLPSVKSFLLILACMFTARNGAMAFNRLADAKLDALNPRTASRHIPSGKLSKKNVAVFIAFNGAAFVFFAWLLNPLAFYCSLPLFLFLLSYSLWKRFSCLSHFMLGIAIGLSPLGAWIAVKGEFAVFPAALGVMLAFWMAGFDIIYASQDISSDRELGLCSIPAKFGMQKSMKISLLCHIAMLAMAVFIGFCWNLGLPWLLAFAVIFIAIAYIHLFRKSSDLDTVNRDFFLANIIISFLVLLGIGIWIFIGDSNAFIS